MAATSGPSQAGPISWAPSESWDGADGDWSSFWLRVGTPGQDVRVLPSTAGQAVWAVAPQGCPPGETGKSPYMDCSDSRGQIFDSIKSASWNSTGFYTMGLEMNLGYNDTAAFGLDTVALGVSDAGRSYHLENQVVATYANDDYFIGMFGLSSQPTNFSTVTNSTPSSLATLKAKNLIPSLSWGYTAGARYQGKGGAFASLTLGGFDSSRFKPCDISFSLHPDVSRDLVVFLQSVTADFRNGSATSLLSDPIPIFIDSTIPYLYLPVSACQEFEKAFGLVWNATYQTYFVDDSLHRKLLEANNNITFRLADSASGSASVEISLPYASFDLMVDSPLVPKNLSGSRYFPLMQASNETQYTLGRTFLQESYLITDYERANFSVLPSRYEDDVKPKIVAIPALNATSKHSMALGSKIGVIIGSIALFSLCTVAVVLFIRSRRKNNVASDGRSATISRDLPQSSDAVDAMSAKEIGINSLIGNHQELPDSGKAELGPIDPLLEYRNDGSQPERLSSSESCEARGSSHDAMMSVHQALEGSMINDKSARNKNKIFVSTDISRQSWANNDLSKEMANVKTTISSRSNQKSETDRSLPPTPISESMQTSPILKYFGRPLGSGETSDAISTQSAMLKSTHGHVGRVASPTPLNAWQRAFAHLSYSSMDMEIVVPPGSSEEEIIRPLTIYKRNGRSRRNFF
ncbi:hypothetical protein ACLMJK_007744 [Lecanora helva]